MAKVTLVKKPRARARRGRQLYPLDIVTLTRKEVCTWLAPFLAKVGGALRALYCPQCGAACQQLIFCPARGPMFQCWRCADFPRKRSMAELLRESKKTKTALAAFVAAHQEKLSPDATPLPTPRVTYTLPHTPRPHVSASNKAKPRRGPQAKARHAAEPGAWTPEMAALLERVQELQRQTARAQQATGKIPPK